MDQRINIENQEQFKLKNINDVNADNISLNTLNSSAYWSGSNQKKAEISLILGDSFTLENSGNIFSQNLLPFDKSTMKNKREDLKIRLESCESRFQGWNHQSQIKNRIIPEKENGDLEDFSKKQNLDNTRSTVCNLILEEDDEEEIDHFLRQREGFKKHCEDEIEDESKDPNFLSDDEIESIIKEKMRILDIYNVVVLKKGKDDIHFR